MTPTTTIAPTTLDAYNLLAIAAVRHLDAKVCVGCDLQAALDASGAMLAEQRQAAAWSGTERRLLDRRALLAPYAATDAEIAEHCIDADCAACMSVGIDFSPTCNGKPCPHWRTYPPSQLDRIDFAAARETADIGHAVYAATDEGKRILAIQSAPGDTNYL